MSLLSETEWLSGGQSSDAPHKWALSPVKRAMQAGLKCDRVPGTPERTIVPSGFRYQFKRKKAFIAMGCAEMIHATHL
jgi:hypothetical protein